MLTAFITSLKLHNGIFFFRTFLTSFAKIIYADSGRFGIPSAHVSMLGFSLLRSCLTRLILIRSCWYLSLSCSARSMYFCFYSTVRAFHYMLRCFITSVNLRPLASSCCSLTKKMYGLSFLGGSKLRVWILCRKRLKWPDPETHDDSRIGVGLLGTSARSAAYLSLSCYAFCL